MQLIRFLGVAIVGLGLLGLGACGGSNPSTTSEPANTTSSPPAASSPEASHSPAAATENTGSQTSKQGGQVVKAGDYHLEFVPSKEGDGTHLDFFLYKGASTEVIPNAKVTAQVEFPDGTLKELPLKYEPEGKHYGEKLPGASAVGDYKVVILTDVNGEKINSRFSFKQ